MTKELEAIERARSLAERIRLDLEGANLALFLAELSQLAQAQNTPLGLGVLDEGELGPAAQAQGAAWSALEAARHRARPPGRADAPVEQGTKVAFYAAGEDTPDPAAVASTVVIARVMGDALLDFRGRPAPDSPAARSRPRQSDDVVVEMVPSDSSQAAEMTLKHSEFGRVWVRVDMSGSRLSVRIELLNARASRIMARAESVLHDALRPHGVQLEKFALSVRGTRPARRANPQHVLDEEA